MGIKKEDIQELVGLEKCPSGHDNVYIHYYSESHNPNDSSYTVHMHIYCKRCKTIYGSEYTVPYKTVGDL